MFSVGSNTFRIFDLHFVCCKSLIRTLILVHNKCSAVVNSYDVVTHRQVYDGSKR